MHIQAKEPSSHLTDPAPGTPIRKLLDAQKLAYAKHPMPSYQERIHKLKALKSALLTFQEPLIQAINQDFSCRSRDETLLAELMPTIESINYAIKHVKKWMKPSKRKVGLLFMPAKNQLHYQPLGVVGIIVPWNYPIFLALGPLIGALSAGNRAMIKMSEFTPHLNKVLIELLDSIYKQDTVAVIEGDAATAIAFTEQAFDHLLFTGSTSVGRHVMMAAAKNLTPVTLELGGKSPAIISPDSPMQEACERLCFGKSLNAGQTCVAPDYILVPKEREQAFIDTYKAVFGKMYPSLKDNDDYSAIINQAQYQRLARWLDEAKNKGAICHEINPAEEDLSQGRKMAPVLVQKTESDMTIVLDEIFGPILPIITYTSLDEALDYVKQRPRPLALYYFGHNKAEQQKVLTQSHAGGVCINDTLVHLAQDDMPFGGVGDSGMGQYHGHEGFLTFSKAKSVHIKGHFNSAKFAYAPYKSPMHKLIYRFFIR
ncbi:Aldehyde dehydrogenase [Marinomonas sp. MED121]|uniref:coniferyl aldehyde dehydrogenase n=1 Tax=Marinomonas sp. MED121 TaxID=314277 RepID=UPI000068FE65|nr:coniferyl aldehyde dehydrogenase [Marinomonas sp. MED121]EAQ66797.1 Aldehyde dehydrogenase [Marinomonas sp. MED121]